MRLRLVHSSVNIGLLVLTNVFWASQFIGYKLVDEHIGPITVTFLSFLIALPVVLPSYLVERWRRTGQKWTIPSKERSFRHWKNTSGFLVIGVLGMVPAAVFGAWGLSLTTASNGALLTLTIPVITALLAATILRERMTTARWGSLAVALVGVLILSMKAPESAAAEGLVINWHEVGFTNRAFVTGNALVLASCFFSSFFNVCSKNLLSRFSALEVLVYCYSLSIITSSAMLVVFEPFSPGVLFAYSARTWAGLLLLGILSWGLAMTLWLFLLTRLDVSLASVSVYLLPFFGVLLAAVFLHEQITLPMIVGGVTTLTGTVLAVYTDGRSSSNAHLEPRS